MSEENGFSASDLRERDEATDNMGDEGVDVQDSAESGVSQEAAQEGPSEEGTSAPDGTEAGQDEVSQEIVYSPVEDANRLYEHLVRNRSQIPRRAGGLLEGLRHFIQVHG